MQCRYCTFSNSDTEALVKHYRLCHAQGHKETNWPCLYSDCVCSFRTQGALKSHLSRCHTRRTCLSLKMFAMKAYYFRHLKGHLRRHETLRCPFAGWEYKTNRLTNFASHSTRKHQTHTTNDLRNQVITETENLNTDTTLNFGDDDDHDARQSSQTVQEATDSGCESVDIETLEHKLASVFLKMQTVLHISKSAIHNITFAVERIKNILVKRKINVDNSILQEIKCYFWDQSSSPDYFRKRQFIYRPQKEFIFYFSVIEPTEYHYYRTQKSLCLCVFISCSGTLTRS